MRQDHQDFHFEVIDRLNSTDVLFATRDKQEAIDYARSMSERYKRRHYVRKEVFNEKTALYESQIVWRPAPEKKPEPVGAKAPPNAKDFVNKLTKGGVAR